MDQPAHAYSGNRCAMTRYVVVRFAGPRFLMRLLVLALNFKKDGMMNRSTSWILGSLAAAIWMIGLTGCQPAPPPGGGAGTPTTTSPAAHDHDHDHGEDGHDHGDHGHDHGEGGEAGEAESDGETGLTDKQKQRIAEAMSELSEEDRALAVAQEICPVGDSPLGLMGKPVKIDVNGRAVFLCCDGCEDAIKEEPDKYLAVLDEHAKKRAGGE